MLPVQDTEGVLLSLSPQLPTTATPTTKNKTETIESRKRDKGERDGWVDGCATFNTAVPTPADARKGGCLALLSKLATAMSRERLEHTGQAPAFIFWWVDVSAETGSRHETISLRTATAFPYEAVAPNSETMHAA